MIKNDLHIHSIQSLCGMHTFLEIVEIAAMKGITTVNICDHGKASGKEMKFGVITNKKRCPKEVQSSTGTKVTVLAGIEANILNINGDSDFPKKYCHKFDLVSAGFHSHVRKLAVEKSVKKNTKALENYLQHYPLDILTHPCIATFPLNITQIVDFAAKYGFALEVNNTNLRVKKTDIDQLKKMILLAKEKGARLIETSDGHTFYEMGENDKVQELLKKMEINGDEIFINRKDDVLNNFVENRKRIRKDMFTQ